MNPTWHTELSDANALKCELASEVLLSFGSLRFTETGWSMLPTIWPGDTLMVEHTNPKRVEVGCVVLARFGGRFRTHRVVGTWGNSGNLQWITQGDANAAPDPCVNANELLGRVTHVVRDGRLIEVGPRLSMFENLLAKIVRRSFTAARALVYLNRMRRHFGEWVLSWQA
jgi:signal peptidase I